MNAYANVHQLKEVLYLDQSSTARDDELLLVSIAASRNIDHVIQREFWVERDTRYFKPHSARRAIIDDVTSIEEISVVSASGTTVLTSYDYYLEPRHLPVKNIIALDDTVNVVFSGDEDIVVTGTFGYGNGTASPWLSINAVATTDAVSTLVDFDINHGLYPGQTILVGSEQMFILATPTTKRATVVRGVNKTTAAIHKEASVYVMQYPHEVVVAALWLAVDMFKRIHTGGILSERLGDHSYTLDQNTSLFVERVLAGLRRFW